MDLNAALAAAPALVAAITAIAPIALLGARRMARMSRTIAALERAVELHDAQNRGVVLLLQAPGFDRGVQTFLQTAGWTVCPHPVAASGTLIPTVDQFWADLNVADVVVVGGYPAEEAAALAGHERFRATLGAGAGVVLFTPNHLTRYDQSLWGPGDQSVTTPATCEAAVRATIARRRVIQQLQGVRPGKLADARRELLA